MSSVQVVWLLNSWVHLTPGVYGSFNYVKSNWDNPSYKKDMKPRNLPYYVLCTLFPLPGYVDEQHGKFLKLWMANLDFGELPDLIEYYNTIENGTLLKEEYTNIENHTLLKDIDYLMYLTQLNFSEDTPNQILHMLLTLILWSRTFYTTIGQYATLYDFLAITPKDTSHWNYYLA